jgi:hypothetical protein
MEGVILSQYNDIANDHNKIINPLYYSIQVPNLALHEWTIFMSVKSLVSTIHIWQNKNNISWKCACWQASQNSNWFFSGTDLYVIVSWFYSRKLETLNSPENSRLCIECWCF